MTNKHTLVLIVILGLGVCGSLFFPQKNSCAADPDYRESVFGVFSSHTVNPKFLIEKGYDTESYYNWANERMKSLGAHWTRHNLIFHWGSIEPELGMGYNWESESTDTIISTIYNASGEIHLLPVIQPLRNDGITPVTNPEAWRSFVQAIAERYDGDGVDDAHPNIAIDYFQLCSEMQEWFDYIGLDTEAYAETASMTLDSLRSANPEAQMVLIATYGRQVLDQSAKEVVAACRDYNIDFWGVDIHVWNNESAWNAAIFPAMRSYLDTLGLETVKIISGENGTFAGCPDNWEEQSEKDQARSLVKRIVWGRANGIDLFFWDWLVDPYQYAENSGTYYDQMGLISDGTGACEQKAAGEERLSFYSFKVLAAFSDTVRSDYIGEIGLCADDCDAYGYQYRLKKTDRNIYILWSEKAGGESVNFSVDSHLLLAIKLVPEYDGGLQTSMLQTHTTTIDVNINTDPLMVIEIGGRINSGL